MNELMTDTAAVTAATWTATLPLVVFFAFFVAMVVWTMTAKIEQPPLE